MKIDAIIFDLDGTLWDSVQAVADSWRASLLRRGESSFPDNEDVMGIMGLTDIQIEEKIFSRYGARAHELRVACMTEEPPHMAVNGGKIYEGVGEMLSRLSARYPLFIVSNCLEGYIEAFFEYSGFGPYFSDYEYLGKSAWSKRDNILSIMERRGVESCLYVGDTENDEKSAVEAGCGFIHAAYGYGGASSPLAVIAQPSELDGLITALEKGD